MEANKTSGEDEEWEEEEALVVIELNGIIDLEALQPETCKILGLEKERPVLQMDNYYFTGSYEEFLGTAVIFKDVKPNSGSDADCKLKYICKTSKKLTMQRCFLQENDVSATADAEDDEELLGENSESAGKNISTVNGTCSSESTK